jgi:hypothetical protein
MNLPSTASQNKHKPAFIVKFSAILLLIGIAIIGYASSLAPYKNEALFTRRYMALSDGQSTEYWKLREDMLTPKFQLQDYGGTVIAIAIVTLIVSRKGWRHLKSPSRAMLFGLAFAAPVLTAGAYVFDLLQGFARGEFPHWADSMAIPLMGIPVLFIILLIWSAAHLAFLRGACQPTPLVLTLSRQANWWLLFISTMTATLLTLSILAGQYWYAIPAMAWLYFYISLAALRLASYAAE